MPMKNWVAVLALACLGWPAAADAMRCSGRVVSSGDYDFQVRERCGEPFWVEQRSELLVSGADGPLERRAERVIEVWYYNFGPRSLVQRLEFVDGRLSRSGTAGYGVNPSQAGRGCSDTDLRRGATTGEVVLRCGRPDSQAVRYRDEIRRDGRGNELLRPRQVEEWIYAGSGGRMARRVTFEDGRISSVTTLPR
ncbi:MAG: DUF2845 domain-containing protein [Lysobacteraceae bacterium]|jgi:hypothetical protein